MRFGDAPWLREEDEFLRENFNMDNVSKIARLMPRHDVVSIIERARKLRLIDDGRGRHARLRVIEGGGSVKS